MTPLFPITVGPNHRAMSYGTIEPYLDLSKLLNEHTVTIIALHGQRIQMSCSAVNLTSRGSYLEVSYFISLSFVPQLKFTVG